MGDRSQVCIKEGKSKVYLYGHWSGTAIYRAAAEGVKAYPERNSDSEYFARIVFCRMVGAEELMDETGYGIGTRPHGDTEHAIPVFDCETETVAWEPGAASRSVSSNSYTFAEWADAALAGKFDAL